MIHSNLKSLFLILIIGAIGLLTGCKHGEKEQKELSASSINPQVTQSLHQNSKITALGTLEPSGDVHVLAGPIVQLGGSPRVRSILVEEGQKVDQNQLLATFDNFSQSQSERDRFLVNIKAKQAEIDILTSEIKRFRDLARKGAFAQASLEEKEAMLAGYQSELKDLHANLRTANARLYTDSQLLSPISGVVLKIYSRVGERADERGVMEIGNIDNMEALLQVDESDINLVRKGQTVLIKSENGSFEGTLTGRVNTIGIKVIRRKRLGIDPIREPDVEERVIDVRASLDPASIKKVRRLTGVKVLATIQT